MNFEEYILYLPTLLRLLVACFSILIAYEGYKLFMVVKNARLSRLVKNIAIIFGIYGIFRAIAAFIDFYFQSFIIFSVLLNDISFCVIWIVIREKRIEIEDAYKGGYPGTAVLSDAIENVLSSIEDILRNSKGVEKDVR